MPEPVNLYLIRHGQTDLNKEKRFRGLADAPLNDAGKYEAAGAAKLLVDVGLSNVFTSPVRRAAETATAIAVTTGARVETDDDFIDIDYGDWQGLTVEEVRERFGKDELESWRRDPGAFEFPGGASMSSVRERLEPALLRVAGSEPEGAVAVVSHLAVLKICFVILMGLDMDYFWKVGLDNGSTGQFTYTPERGFVLERWNRPPMG
ncbi:MAG: histidine phosphatase family protein [Candidatus Geothermincolia bacterium]